MAEKLQQGATVQEIVRDPIMGEREMIAKITGNGVLKEFPVLPKTIRNCNISDPHMVETEMALVSE